MSAALVTGGTSGPGRLVVSTLLDRGDRVVALARTDRAARELEARGAVVVRGDLETVDELPVGRAELLLHVAGVRYSEGARALADLWDVSGAVCVSSASAMADGHPLRSLINEHERRLLENDRPWRVLRPTMIFGSPTDRNIRLLARTLHRLPAVPLLTGGGLVQPVFVDDVAAAIVELGDRWGDPSGPPPELNLGGEKRLTLGELVADLADGLHLRQLPMRVPIDALAGIARRSGLSERNRVLHAVAMLTTDRVVEDPDSIGLRHRPTRWNVALAAALGRYFASWESTPSTAGRRRFRPGPRRDAGSP